MTLDGFLTFLGLAVAVYAIIPPVARLRIRLQLIPQAVLAVSALALTLYFEFFQFLSLPCLAALRPLCHGIVIRPDSPFTPPMAAFAVVLVWMMLAWLVAVCLPPSQRSIRLMADIVEMLFHQQRYAEAVDFVLPRLGFVDRAQSRKLWNQQLKGWLSGAQDIERRRAWRIPIRFLSTVVPSGDHAYEHAERMLNSLYFSRQFIDYVSTQRPSFAATLVTLHCRQRFGFSDRLLSNLISTPGSRLYDEIERNSKHVTLGTHLIVDHNVILRAYFLDCNVAVRLLAWMPVGNFVVDYIRTNGAELNGRSDGFDGHPWRDPCAVAIAYFDLMVRSAFSQDIQNNMWLGYLHHFVTELVEIYDASGDEIDSDTEFPTWSARLIYECISTLAGWVQFVRQAPVQSVHSKIPGSFHRGTASIPATAAQSIGVCLFRILSSTRIGDSFARDMLVCVLTDIQNLVQPEERAARAFLIRAVATGGGRENATDYGQRLADLVGGIDHVLLSSVPDFLAAARATHPQEKFPEWG